MSKRIPLTPIWKGPVPPHRVVVGAGAGELVEVEGEELVGARSKELVEVVW